MNNYCQETQHQKLEAIGGKLAGYELWWTIPSALVTRADYLEARYGTSIPSYYLKDRLGRSECFNRATSATLANEISRILKQEISFKKISLKDSYAKGIMLSVQEGTKLIVHQIGTVSVSSNSSYIASVSVNPDHRHYQESLHGNILDLVKKEVDARHDPTIHDRDDVVFVLLNFCREHGFSLRESGGIYFIPDSSSRLLHDIKDFVLKCIPKSKIYLKKEYILEDSELEVYREVYRSDLLKEFASMQATYRDLIGKIATSAPKRTTNSWLETLKDFKLSQERIERFSAALDTSESLIAQQMRKMRRELTQKLEDCRITVHSSLKSDFSVVDDESDDLDDLEQESIPPHSPAPAPVPIDENLKSLIDSFSSWQF